VLIVPAIDLLQGQAVRLVQGDYATPTFYGDPIDWLTRWRNARARLIHVVDLDGARDGRPSQLALIKSLAGRGVPLQVGGGIRSVEDARAVIEAGARRIVLGTTSVEDPVVVDDLVAEFGNRVLIAIDCRDGIVVTRGWTKSSGAPAAELAQSMAARGVQRFLVTDVRRDGTMTTPNYELLEEMVGLGLSILASGGVSTVEAVTRLDSIGVEGAIVGRALYEGTVTMAEITGALHAG